MTRKYVVRFKIPHHHVVKVGVEADNPDDALATAEAWFDGDDLDDTAETPLLQDEWDECDGAAEVVMPYIEEQAGDWPEPDGSVEEHHREGSARLTCRLLVDALDGAADGQPINMRDLAMAYQAAKFALGRK